MRRCIHAHYVIPDCSTEALLLDWLDRLSFDELVRLAVREGVRDHDLEVEQVGVIVPPSNYAHSFVGVLGVAEDAACSAVAKPVAVPGHKQNDQG